MSSTLETPMPFPTGIPSESVVPPSAVRTNCPWVARGTSVESTCRLPNASRSTARMRVPICELAGGPRGPTDEDPYATPLWLPPGVPTTLVTRNFSGTI
jgi:hypothetical protein